MRAKGICLALDIEPSPKHIEATRAKLKRMVNHHVLAEDEPRSVHPHPETDLILQTTR